VGFEPTHGGLEEPCTRVGRSSAFAQSFVRGSGGLGVAFLPRPLTVFPFDAPCSESGKTYKGLPDFRRSLYGLS
jgi:hypothetical protein